MVKDLGTFDEKSEFNMGTPRMAVYGETRDNVFTVDGTSLPARPQEHGTLAEGLHHFMLGFHRQTRENRHLAFRACNFENQPVMNDYNPSNGRAYGVALNLHHVGYSNKTGKTSTGAFISEGCLLCDINEYGRLISAFDQTTQSESMRAELATSTIIWFGGLATSFDFPINPVPYYSYDANGNTIFHPSPLPNPVIAVAINRASNSMPAPNEGQSVWNEYNFPKPPKRDE